MTLPIILFISIAGIGILAIGIAVFVLIKRINQDNAINPPLLPKKPKISRRIRRQIEDIIRSYENEWEKDNTDDDTSNYPNE